MPIVEFYDHSLEKSSQLISFAEVPQETINQCGLFTLVKKEYPNSDTDGYVLFLSFPSIAGFLKRYLELPFSAHDHKFKRISISKFEQGNHSRFEKIEDFHHEEKRKLFESIFLSYDRAKIFLVIKEIIHSLILLEFPIGLIDVSILANTALCDMTLSDFINVPYNEINMDTIEYDQIIINEIDRNQSTIFVYDE